jgi:quinol monooxygenase YgiN
MKHAYLNTLVVIAELTITPDKVEDFLDYTVGSLAASRSSPGNIAFDILIDETTPHAVIFYEVWESAEAQQAYMAWRVQAGDLTKLLSFLSAPPKFTSLRSIAAPPQAPG